MPYTKGFVSREELEEHFDLHGSDFNASNEEHYQALADAFMGGQPRQTTHECYRKKDGKKIRFDHLTNEFGVLTPDNYILIYYIPQPNRHGRQTNMQYFNAECNRSK